MKSRAAKFIRSLKQSADLDHLRTAFEIATEGIRLRSLLSQWQDMDMLLVARDGCPPCHLRDLTHILHSATDIYLSGVFDYELIHWQMLGVVVPTLDENSIQMHVARIIHTSQQLLIGSAVSPLLLLFPLRVAGARSWSKLQQTSIASLLSHIETMFLVAAAFRQELTELWETRGKG